MAVYFDLNMYTPTKRAQAFDVDSIYQSIAVLLNTRPGEVLFQPEFGIALEEELFEFVDDATALTIFTTVTDALIRFEPRVRVDNARTTVTPYPDENKFEVDLYFQIPGLSAEVFRFSGELTNQGAA